MLYRETGRPQIIVTDGNKQAEALYPLLRTFCDLLDAGTVPLLLPALDVMPGQECRRMRKSSLPARRHSTSWRGAKPELWCCRWRLALSRTETPAYYRQLTLTLKTYEEVSLEDLAAHLESFGYERQDPVEMVGQYSIRGGILDVFSPDQTQPVRVEFFGDEIESIRRFDPETQRSVHKLNECVLAPLTEFRRSRQVLQQLADHLREAGLRGRDLPVGGETFAGWELMTAAVCARESTHPRLL